MGYAEPGQVRSIAAKAGGLSATTTPRPSGAFAIVFPGTIATSDVRVSLSLASGAVRRYDGSVNVVQPEVLR